MKKLAAIVLIAILFCSCIKYETIEIKKVNVNVTMTFDTIANSSINLKIN